MTEQHIPAGYWVCACVKRDRKGKMTAIKYNPPAVEVCAGCKLTKTPENTVKAAQVRKGE